MSRVLVVDDDPQIVRAVRVNLSARGYTVTSAYSGRKALAEAAEVRPDVVVLDLGLPDLDGVDVIADLRRWTPVPIVVLSGRAASGDKVEALDAGADDYVTKPFDVDELVARIRAVTRRTATLGASTPIRLGDYVIDLDNQRITLAAARTESGTEPTRRGNRPRGPPDPDPVAAAGGAGAQPRPSHQPAATAQRGLGSPVRDRNPLRPPVHGPAAP